MEKREVQNRLTGKKETWVYYKIPLNLIFRDYLFWTWMIFLLGIFAAFAVPTLIVRGYIPNIYANNMEIFVLVFLLLLMVISQGAYDLGGGPVCGWIVENEKCPACNGSIKSCSVRQPPGKVVPPTRGYRIQCSECNKKFIFYSSSMPPFENELLLDGETNEIPTSSTMKMAQYAIIIFLILLVLAIVTWRIYTNSW
jgi:hypothetical protein